MAEILSPHDADVEGVILGTCLIETTAMVFVADKLRPEMFYEDKNAEVFATLLSMHQAGKSIDLITVKRELATRGTLESVGGPFGLTQLTINVISSAHLEMHVMILRNIYVRREMIHGLQRILSSAADETTGLDELLVQMHKLMDHLTGEAAFDDYLRDMNQLMLATLTEAENRMKNNHNGITGVPSGLRELDKITAGWQPGDLIIIAARPSIGKTAFALQLALAAGKAGKHVVVYSLEMQGERLGDRWLCAQAPDVNARHLTTGQLTAAEWKQSVDAARQLVNLPIKVDDNPKMNMEHIRASARLQKSKGACDMIIVDYLQLCEMQSEQKNRNREQEVAEASRKAKLLAKEMNIPVILLCQLNRECEARGDRRPALSDLRESGAIEQDADVVMLLYRPAVYGLLIEPRSGLSSEGLGMVIVAKHRNGETGDVYFGHNASMTKLGDFTDEATGALIKY